MLINVLINISFKAKHKQKSKRINPLLKPVVYYMQSLLHYRMQEEQLISKIKTQEAVLSRKGAHNPESSVVLDNIKKLQIALAEKQLEIEKILNYELKKLVEALKSK
jgi:hypothetical protein